MWLGTLKTTNHYLFVPIIRFSQYVHSKIACFTGSFSYQDNQPDYSDYQQIMMSMTKKPEYHNTVNVFYQHRSRLFPVSDINFDKNSMQCKNFTQDFCKSTLDSSEIRFTTSESLEAANLTDIMQPTKSRTLNIHLKLSKTRKYAAP